MRIGIVCYPTFGGSGVVATELGKALAKKGHQIHFITYSRPVKLEDITKNITYHEVTITDYPLFEYSPYELVLTSKLVDVAIFENLDILHVHYAIPHASAAYMARQILLSKNKYVPFITTLHGTDITLLGKNESFEPVISFAINQSDAVTAVSNSLREDTYKHFPIKKDIKVIPNFICLENYDKKSNFDFDLKRSFAPNNEKILTHISNFRKVKRVEDIVKVFDQIRKKIPAKLILVGDGPERHNIQKICRELDRCDDIKLLGKIKTTEKILAVSDLFLLTSETESFGLAALEAMAASVPVISTNRGGLKEVNANNFSGFLSDVGDINDMAKNALYILKDEGKLNAFRKNALTQAEKFSIQNILPKYELLYNQVLQQAEHQINLPAQGS